MNIASLQRTVFRMEHDPEFAARVLAAEPDALRSARLGPNELALLRSVDPAAYSADRGASASSNSSAT